MSSGTWEYNGPASPTSQIAARCLSYTAHSYCLTIRLAGGGDFHVADAEVTCWAEGRFDLQRLQPGRFNPMGNAPCLSLPLELPQPAMDRIKQFPARIQLGAGPQFRISDDRSRLLVQEHQIVGQFVRIDLLGVRRKGEVDPRPMPGSKDPLLAMSPESVCCCQGNQAERRAFPSPLARSRRPRPTIRSKP